MSGKKEVVRVKDVMTQDYAMVDGLVTIKEALDLFKQKSVSVLLINKRHEDDEYGILLLSDIAKEVVAKDRAPERVNVYEVMAKPVLSVEARMDVRYCARMFDNFGLASAPVIDNGQVMGVVGYNDIVLKGLI
ncbi:CBS domain-containing protein [Pontibacterium sp. N1Y112]|uniref:CBS domain-containing protein n=1 Tax=Pontibacterium sinense TaxID=2781979 RepID=A0A8J7FCW7_9GAMM|nr:CBS domain-containing protein [Pontibacterium sinense]MBE9397404.1 CBS domain-containing protein [Pontibacterium sinense]